MTTNISNPQSCPICGHDLKWHWSHGDAGCRCAACGQERPATKSLSVAATRHENGRVCACGHGRNWHWNERFECQCDPDCGCEQYRQREAAR